MDGLEYVLPFKVGALWGADPAYGKRDDLLYQWAVDDKLEARVPLGKFKGCYDLFYRTLPDHEERWVCPGVGLVADKYEHHGTESQYRIELQSYTERSSESIPIERVFSKPRSSMRYKFPESQM